MFYRKFVIFLLLFIVCFVCKGQQENKKFEDVYFHLLYNNSVDLKGNSYYPLTLLIENKKSHYILIENFNRIIYYVNDYIKNRKFYCDLFTLANEKPEDFVLVGPGLVVKSKKIPKKTKKQIDFNDFDIVVQPNSVYEVDIYIKYSSFIYYSDGFYKLRLYDAETNQCVAETIIKYERTKKRKR